MTRKDAFSAIKILLFGDEFTNAKCSDGTILKWSGGLKEGVAITVIGADGSEVPAEDKTFDMEDGSKITSVGGLVTKVEPKAAEGDGMEELAEAVVTLAKQHNELKEQFKAFAEMKAAHDALAEKFTAIEKAVTDNNTSVTEKFEAIKTLVESIADEPAAEPVQKFGKKKKDGITAAEKLAAYLKEQKKNS